MKRLVIHCDQRPGAIGAIENLIQRFPRNAAHSGTPVLPPYEGDATRQFHGPVAKDVDAMIAQIVHGRFDAADILMVPCDGVDPVARLEAAKFFTEISPY